MKVLKFSLSYIQKQTLACAVALLFSAPAFAMKEESSKVVKKETKKKNGFSVDLAEKYRKEQDYKNYEDYWTIYLHGKNSSTQAYDCAKKAVEKHYDPCAFYNLWRNYIHGLELSTPSREYSTTILGWLIVFNILHMADIKCCVALNHVYRSCDKDQNLRFKLMQDNYKHRFEYYKEKIAIDYSIALKKAEELFRAINLIKLPRPIWARYIKNTTYFSTWVSFETPSRKSRKFFGMKQVRQAVNRLRVKVFQDMWKKLKECKSWSDFWEIKETDIKDKELDVEYVNSDDEKEMKDCLHDPGQFDFVFTRLCSDFKKVTLDDLKERGDFKKNVSIAIDCLNVDDVIEDMKAESSKLKKNKDLAKKDIKHDKDKKIEKKE